uniref:Uncharacterized protein n=1 Tax=Arundo donax TaxID=35708 RepID=A0A0A9GZR1_ARUDO
MSHVHVCYYLGIIALRYFAILDSLYIFIRPFSMFLSSG